MLRSSLIKKKGIKSLLENELKKKTHTNKWKALFFNFYP